MSDDLKHSTSGGRDTAAAIGKAENDGARPAAQQRDFKAFLLSTPSLDGIDLTSDNTPATDIDL
jgi:hypothetical protein